MRPPSPTGSGTPVRFPLDEMAASRARSRATTRLLNRELSWLDFDARVLELAADPQVPLLERVKFCAIFASNLDEFFAVRVAGLLGQADSGVALRSPDGRTPVEALREVRAQVERQIARQGRIWEEELQPQLAAYGIVVGSVADCTQLELGELGERFDREVFPILTPLAVGAGLPFPYISPLTLSLGVFVRDPLSGEERFARVKVPETLPRFVGVGVRGLLVPLEQVIAHYLSSLFPGMEVVESAVFRLTRDADFDVSDEADDLLEAVELELRRRRFGDVVRLEVGSSVSPQMLARLQEGVGASEDELYVSGGLVGLSDLMQIAGLDRPELKDPLFTPVTPARLEGGRRELFAEIRRRDVLVHHPYDSFRTSVGELLRAAVADPGVEAVKTTVYRTSDDSPVVPALIEAAEQGKQTVCLVELKARFDEHRNIEWSRAMEKAGVHVLYGFPSLKIHAKTTLLVRREGDVLRRYVHIGTGNYNAVTARLYEDFGLFTADEEIAADVADLFNFLTGFGRPAAFRKLLVAPFSLRSRLLEEIQQVAAAAEAGERARIRIKVNALVDPPVIEALYAASRAGAEIDVVARSICALVPGVEGLSETIRVRSVVGRFLEHSRFFLFDAGERSAYFMGSADLMPRNLDHRIEVVTPVEDERVREQMDAVFATLLADNVGAWELGSDGGWQRLQPGDGDKPRSAHATLMRRAKARGRRRVKPKPKGDGKK